jgi:hypothetical protein
LSGVGAVRNREVAIVGVGPDDSWEDRDETRTEDDAAEVANMSDSGLSEDGLPAHEDDSRRTEDTGSGEQNP